MMVERPMSERIGIRTMLFRADARLKRKAILAAFVPALLFLLFSPTYSASGGTGGKIVLDTDRSVYSIGMEVIMAGQVVGSFVPNSPATITVAGPSGTPYHSTSVNLDMSGGFTHQFVIEGDQSIVGSNTLEVTHGMSSGEAKGSLSFEVRDRASITMATDRSSYSLGDDVTLQIKVTPVLLDSPVLIQVFNPKNVAWLFDSISSGKISPDGQIDVRLGKLTGDRSIIGTYTVKAFYASATASAQMTFQVVDQAAQPSKKDPKKEEAHASQGEVKKMKTKLEVVEKEETSVTAAEIAKETVVESEIKNAEQETQEFTYIVLIKDSDGITTSLSWASATIAPNESLTMGKAWIPEKPGEYVVEIYVWESLANPMPLSDKTVKTIVVA